MFLRANFPCIRMTMYQNEPELRRLMDLLPASGRMWTKLINKPEQKTVIDSPFPYPWVRQRTVAINFDLWHQLPPPERDLLILRTVGWVTSIQWFRPNLYQAGVALGALGAVVQATQGDAVGMMAAGALSAIAGTQIWRANRSTQLELDADEQAIKTAQRRDYEEAAAARHLLDAITHVAELEGRPSLTFVELLRSQNLRAIAGLSPTGIPTTVRKGS
jgi:Protein of unknown function (DUF3318)